MTITFWRRRARILSMVGLKAARCHQQLAMVTLTSRTSANGEGDKTRCGQKWTKRKSGIDFGDIFEDVHYGWPPQSTANAESHDGEDARSQTTFFCSPSIASLILQHMKARLPPGIISVNTDNCRHLVKLIVFKKLSQKYRINPG